MKLVRENLKVMTLAIGDGANDVSMLQTAEVCEKIFLFPDILHIKIYLEKGNRLNVLFQNSPILDFKLSSVN